MTVVVDAGATRQQARPEDDVEAWGRWMRDVREELVGFARGRFARAAGASRLVRDGVGDLDAAAQDVVAEVLAVLWARRQQWAQVRDLRSWAFGVTRVQVARHVRAARARASVEVPLPEDAERLVAADDSAGCERTQRLGLGPAGASVGVEHADALWLVRAGVVDRLGAEAWDVVVDAACGRATARGCAVRAAAAEQVHRVEASAGVDVARVAAAARVPITVWARGQRAAGRRLDPARAVRDGVAARVSLARRALAVWWVQQQLLAGHPVTVDELVAAGLVDDREPAARCAAARVLAAWLTWTHPDLAAAAAVPVPHPDVPAPGRGTDARALDMAASGETQRLPERHLDPRRDG